jgi:hypothetical protein
MTRGRRFQHVYQYHYDLAFVKNDELKPCKIGKLVLIRVMSDRWTRKQNSRARSLGQCTGHRARNHAKMNTSLFDEQVRGFFGALKWEQRVLKPGLRGTPSDSYSRSLTVDSKMNA